MGSATREALAASRAELSTLGTATLETAEELFSVARILTRSAHLRAILSETNGDPEEKAAVISAVFGTKLGEPTIRLLYVVVEHRWSDQDDLVAGIEELGLRLAADSCAPGTSIEAELFTFVTAIASDHGLELALASKFGNDAAKVELVTTLLENKVSPQTLAIARQLVQHPRGRRISDLLRTAAAIVADQAGLAVATVTSASPIAAAQLQRLQKGLAKSYGRELRLNLVVDPEIIGGLRVQVADDVFDGSVARKLADLRLEMAR